jgi:hypothetical protein
MHLLMEIFMHTSPGTVLTIAQTKRMGMQLISPPPLTPATSNALELRSRAMWAMFHRVSTELIQNAKRYKKFWEKLIAYFPFTVIWASHMISRKKTLVCMRNEVHKRIQFKRLQCWYYWWEWFMKYIVEMASDDMIHLLSFMKSGRGVQAIKVLPHQF